VTLRAGIIGAGRIAWAYDGGGWDGKRAALSLASCLDRHPGTALVAVHEPVAAAREAFERGYAGPRPVAVHGSLDRFLAERLDLVMIASPTARHAEHIDACLDVAVPRLWVEKPVTSTMAAFDALHRRLDALGDPPRHCVNYTRRCLPQLHRLKSHLDAADGGSGSVSIALEYSRGLDVNGVHLLDALGYLTGARQAPPLDYLRDAAGPNPQFGLRLAGHPVTVTGHDLPYHLIELSVTDARGRMSLVRGAQDLIWEAAEPNPDFAGFFRLRAPVPVPWLSRGETALQEGPYRLLCALLDESMSMPSTVHTARFAQALLAHVQQRGVRHEPDVPGRAA